MQLTLASSGGPVRFRRGSLCPVRLIRLGHWPFKPVMVGSNPPRDTVAVAQPGRAAACDAVVVGSNPTCHPCPVMKWTTPKSVGKSVRIRPGHFLSSSGKAKVRFLQGESTLGVDGRIAHVKQVPGSVGSIPAGRASPQGSPKCMMDARPGETKGQKIAQNFPRLRNSLRC